MSHSRHRRELAEDMERLRRLLEREIAPVAEPLAEKKELAILDLACGACDEAATLSDFFASLREDRGLTGHTTLVGTDVRERELDLARERFRDAAARRFEFFKGDASKLSAHRQLRERFDVLFLRHQNLYHGRTLWQHIFEQGMNKLDDDGLLVMTSYFDREHRMALEALDRLGLELVSTTRNEHSRALTTPGKSVDRHLAVLRKKRRP